MDKYKIIEDLKGFRERLLSEVVPAYEQRGSSFGKDRFQAWWRRFSKYLDQYIPGESSILNQKLIHFAFMSLVGESDVERFWREDGEKMVSYIDSLILDLENDEYVLLQPEEDSKGGSEVNADTDCERIFIVHGHDGEAKERTARFVEKLGFKPIILNEQVSRGLTIIEKIEKYSNVRFAIVLYTPDDLGNTESEAKNGILSLRARQNVIFEHGFLIGKIGRENVVPLVAGNVELPSDISGIVYISDKS